MTKINNLLILMVALLSVSSCHIHDDDGIFNCTKGEGNTITKDLNVSEFTGVKLEIASDIYITQGSEFDVYATGQENIINELELDVKDGVWEVHFDGCVKNYSELIIYITMPTIEYLSISGSGTFYGENTFDVDELGLKISGSGDMIFDLNAFKIEANITGSGNMKLSGVSEIAEYKISGSGNYHAFDLQTNIAEVRISGSGDTEVTAEDYLKVNISGSGDVFYKGNPTLDISITGSGNVYDSN